MTDFKYDFHGIASRYNTPCTDNRIIHTGAFSEDTGKIVPLIWQHDRSSPRNVLGKALLKDERDGLHCYCSLNNTPEGKHMKECIRHGDLRALSVFANGLRERTSGLHKSVQHGSVKEVSVVLSGANPGAVIDNIMIHSDDGSYSAEICFYDEENYADFISCEKGIIHSSEVYGEYDDDDDDYLDHDLEDDDDYDDDDDDDDDLPEEPEDDESEDDEPEDDEERTESEEDQQLEHSDGKSGGSVLDVLKTLNPQQRNAVEFLMNTVAAEVAEKFENNKEENSMKHSFFEQNVQPAPTFSREEQHAFLMHCEEENLSLRKTLAAFIDSENDSLQHDDDPAQTYGITDIEYLFPNAKNYTDKPEFIKRRTEWVNRVFQGVHTTPFSKIKSLFADITKDDARAKGYTKGDLKEDEVFELLTRETSPQTIYKRQRIDRDDRIDIIDFDVVLWIKGEMRLMWEEEVARAVLIGDGRSNDNKFKIKEDKIRPIWKDASLYTVPVRVGVASGTTDDARTNAIIRQIIKDRKKYKGSGSPILFTTEDFIADCLLLTDDIGHFMYESLDKLATKLRVSAIIPVEVMEGQSRSVKLTPDAPNNTTVYLDAIMVNLTDYNMGADKGGKAEMFEDFDLDYNQYIFLYEGRCSGALVKPYSAMAIEHYTVVTANNSEQAAG